VDGPVSTPGAAEGRSVRLVGLEKRFDGPPVVHALDLDVAAGERVVLVGPSGCGKTTILRLIAGLEEPTAGEVWIGERAVTHVEPAERDVAMVFQSYALYPHMSVRENLGFGLRMRGVPRAVIADKTARAAEALGLTGLLERRPGQLSGGQRQRVAFGRALVREPAVFLFDEPLSNLDARLRADLRGEIAELHARLGTTMVYVTHDQLEAMTLGQRIALLDAGRLQQYAPPLVAYREPANLFVASFLGTPAINTVEGTLTRDGSASVFRASGLELRLAARAYAGPAVLGVRPESLAIASQAGAHLATRVQRLEPLGNELLVHVAGPDGRTWVARCDAETRLSAAEGLGLRLDLERCHVFGGPGAPRLLPARA